MSSFSSSVNTESPAPTLAKLSESLTTLAQTLDPLLAQPFQELREKLEGGSSVTANGEGEKDELGGKLDAARMQVSVAYVVLDLVWIYLKTKGIDPVTHPVYVELERVKSYFGKIKAVQAKEKEDEHAYVDKSAAGRFIRAALSGASAEPQGKHTRFDAPSPQTKAAEAEEESSEDSESSSEDEAEAGPSSGKGKQKEVPAPKVNKKGRTIADPFEGYENPSKSSSKSKKRKASSQDVSASPSTSAPASPAPLSTSTSAPSAPTTPSAKRKKSKSNIADSPASKTATPGTPNTPDTSGSEGSGTPGEKLSKKARKKLRVLEAKSTTSSPLAKNA